MNENRALPLALAQPLTEKPFALYHWVVGGGKDFGDNLLLCSAGKSDVPILAYPI